MEFIFFLTTMLFLAIMCVLFLWVGIATVFLVKSRGRMQYSKERPPISVIIPAYNEEKNIKRCIESVKNSIYPSEMEIIVVDDGSSDRTTQIAEGLGARVIKQNHMGKVEALNRGISESKYDFVVTIDADMFIESNSIEELAKGFTSDRIAAVSGVAKVYNKGSVLSIFQNVEYIYLYFMREAFSFLFKASPGICGPLTCFRKNHIMKVNGFSKRTSAEDFDVSLHLFKAGYQTALSTKAIGYTVVPENFQDLFRQRLRWSKGILQSIFLHKRLIGKSFSASYILLTHLFWFIAAIFSIPLIAYNVLYWVPYNSQNFIELFLYLFYWFSFAGIIRMIYMIPVWGVNMVYVFGIISGIITFILTSIALKRYGDSILSKNILGIFFYFPYTLLLNMMLISSMIFFIMKRGKGTFLK